MNAAKEFTIDLISNASMEVFDEITMAKFRNQLSQPLILDGEWQVALSSISFPSNINNVNSNGLVVYKNSGVELDASNNRSGHLRKIRKAFTLVWINSWMNLGELLSLNNFILLLTKLLINWFYNSERMRVFHLKTKKFQVFSASRV